MATQPETRLQRRIQKRLRAEVGGWWFKVWGGPFQKAGIPDLVGCVDGLFFALEVKRPGEDTSSLQDVVMRDIRRQGGGVAQVVESPEEAVDVVKAAIREARRSPEGRR